MWNGDRIYFVSERDENRQANLYVLDLKTKQTRQLTTFTEFAVKFPSLGDSAIVFENGGYLHRFDLATEQVDRIPIEIREDFASGRGGLAGRQQGNHVLRRRARRCAGGDRARGATSSPSPPNTVPPATSPDPGRA